MCRSSSTSDSGVSGLELVVQKASTDGGFRRALLTDPHAAIAEGFGLELPKRFRLRFIEKPPDVDVVVVLPDLAPDSCRALPLQVLDDASGGHEVWTWLTRELTQPEG
jgi:hypothetical protein